MVHKFSKSSDNNKRTLKQANEGARNTKRNGVQAAKTNSTRLKTSFKSIHDAIEKTMAPVINE